MATQLGREMIGGGRMGGGDSQDVVEIFAALHALACRDRLPEDAFRSAIVQTGFELYFTDL